MFTVKISLSFSLKQTFIQHWPYLINTAKLKKAKVSV